MSASSTALDTRRLVVFLAIAFGLAWLVGLVIYVTGGLAGSPVLLQGAPITLALVLLATGYMFAPAVANVLTRLLTGEGVDGLWLRPRIRENWRYWGLAWVGPVVLTLLGVVVYFAVFPDQFDASLSGIAALDLPVDPWTLVALQVLQALLLAPIVNAVFTFGEEFGWRAYLLPKLLPLGERRAVLVSGVVWGVWHWPIVAMGYNYGFGYTGAPYLGFLAMVWFTVLVGVFLSWVTLRGESVWPAVVGHAAINGIAALGLLFVRGTPNLLLGPAPTGLLASVPWLVLALVLLRGEALGLTSQRAPHE